MRLDETIEEVKKYLTYLKIYVCSIIKSNVIFNTKINEK